MHTHATYMLEKYEKLYSKNNNKIRKVKFVDCDPQCILCKNVIDTKSEEGWWCEECSIIFNTCRKCDNEQSEPGILMLLTGWGHGCGNAFGCEKHDGSRYECKCPPKPFKYTAEDKYYASENDKEALDEESGYRWRCPKCNYEMETHAD